MKDMMRKFDESNKVFEAFAKLDSDIMMPTLAMIIDQTAMVTGMSSVELIDFIRPVIAEVNEQMGHDGLVQVEVGKHGEIALV